MTLKLASAEFVDDRRPTHGGYYEPMTVALQAILDASGTGAPPPSGRRRRAEQWVARHNGACDASSPA
jgi:hypothetical protein